MTQEKPKRLTPGREVLRELYLKSGNQCAFPRCREVMIDSDGTFVGEVCHIEAAMPDGQRFNKNQSNEDRRALSNLMLMCMKHHKKTDDVKKHSVEVLRKMKADHEAKFTDIAQRIQDSIIVDLTEAEEITRCATLEAMNAALGWGHGEAELEEDLKEVNTLAEQIRRLPVPTRELLVVVVKRAHIPRHFGGRKLEVAVSEIELATGLSRSDMLKHLQLLDKYGITQEGFENDYAQPQVEIRALKSGWPFFKDLRDYCSKRSIAIEDIIVRLNFELLD